MLDMKTRNTDSETLELMRVQKQINNDRSNKGTSLLKFKFMLNLRVHAIQSERL